MMGSSSGFISCILLSEHYKIIVVIRSSSLIVGNGTASCSSISFSVVLHVRSFSHNLHSISHSTKSLNFTVKTTASKVSVIMGDYNFGISSSPHMPYPPTVLDNIRRWHGDLATPYNAYYEGQLSHFAEEDAEDVIEPEVKAIEAAQKVSLLEENIMPRANLPPLLVHLRERRPEKLHYIGVSFGLTRDLFRFWRKHNFVPFYLGHVPNGVTGEHTCMVLRSLNSDDIEAGNSSQLGFLEPFFQDFRRRFSRLLCTTFQNLDYKLAMSILASKINFNDQEDASTMSNNLYLESLLSPFDMKRLEAYTNNSVDYHMILDLVSVLAYHYFQGQIPVSLSPVQASVLFCIGMQNQDVTHIKEEMKLQREQILSLFIKVMKKLYNYLYSVATKEFDATLPRLREVTLAPLSVSVDDDLTEGAREVKKNFAVDNGGSLNPELLQKYAIVDREGDFEKALPNAAGKVPPSGLVSIKSSRKNMEIVSQKEDKRKRKDKMKGDKKSNKKVRN